MRVLAYHVIPLLLACSCNGIGPLQSFSVGTPKLLDGHDIDGIQPELADVRSPAWPPNMADLVVSKGYPLSEHWVTTDDGYILHVFNIARQSPQQSEASVLLMHGLLDSSAAWVSNGGNESLAFILADAGFDVWLGNVRGSTWGREHRSLSTADDAFWDFTWDEMATHDLPAIVRHIVTHAGRDDILYVGHSQGSTVALAALSESTYVARHIAAAALLAPVAFASHTTSSVLQALAKLPTARVVARFGIRSFLPGTRQSSAMFSDICYAWPKFCADFLDGLCGPSDGLNATRLPGYLEYVPAGTSVMNMEHWAQNARRAQDLRFMAMDFGRDCASGPWPGRCNQLAYGRPEPKEYPLHNIRSPLFLYSGGRDVLASPLDVEFLLEALPGGTIRSSAAYPQYSHLDFTLGTTVHLDVYADVVTRLTDVARRRRA